MDIVRSFRKWLKRFEANEWDKRAFSCAKCPREGCPAWTSSYQVVDPETAQLIEVDGCSFQILPLVLGEVASLTHGTKQAQHEQIHTIKKASVMLGRTMQNVQGAIEENTRKRLSE